METHKIALRYARALLRLAAEDSSVSKTRDGLREFVSLTDSKKEFELWIADPEISKTRRDMVITEISAAIDATQTLTKFFQILIHRERIGLIKEIQHEFNRLADDYEGIVRADVCVANIAAGATIKEDVKKLLKDKFKKDVEVTLKEDPSLVGGFVVRVGDKIWDASIARTLSEIKEKICQ